MPDRYYGPKILKYHESYVRNSRLVGVLWAVFSICLCVISIVVFILPYYIGERNNIAPDGYFGLYKYCRQFGITVEEHCVGNFTRFDTILTVPFQICTILVGVSALLNIACIVCFLLFLCVTARTVYCLCGWLQLFSCLCLSATSVVYPLGWNHDLFKQVCGPESGIYQLGNCQLQWTYILCMIGAVDALLLCTLAFVLAVRQAKLKKKYFYAGSPYHGTASRTLQYPPPHLAGPSGPIITPLDESMTPPPTASRYSTSQRTVQL